MDRSISFILCCGSLVLLIVHQSFSFSDFGEKNRLAKVLLVKHELTQFNDSNERENASIHWIVDSWAQADAAKESAERAKESARNLTTELDNLKIEKGQILSEKNSLDKDFHALKIPVLVRTIRDRIQEKWPKPSRCETCLEFGHPTKKCTALQRTLKSSDPGEEKLRETERYWDYLVREYGNELEMKVFVSELHRAYNNTEMFKQYSYDEYQRTFFRYLGVACRITDSKVHIDLVLTKIKQLNVFGCPIDEFMTPLVRALGYLVDPNIPAVILEHSVETSESTPIGSSSLTTP